MNRSKVCWEDQNGNVVQIINGICECGKKLDVSNKGAISTHCINYKILCFVKKIFLRSFLENGSRGRLNKIFSAKINVMQKAVRRHLISRKKLYRPPVGSVVMRLYERFGRYEIA